MAMPFYRQLIAILTLGLILVGCQSEQQQAPQQRPAPTVTVMMVEKSTANVMRTYVGRVHGAREVEIRTRVQGILEERLFEEGQRVAQGDALFRIDPKPFAIALQIAQAEEQSVAADLTQAQREWQRISRLYQQNAVSQREYDNARSAHELAQARKALAQARSAQAQLELSYTLVEAPAGGITSLEVLPEGSLVERGTLLSTIVQLDPIHVRFSMPEQDAGIQRSARLRVAGNKTSPVRHQAQLVMADGSLHPRIGEIDFTASTIDPQTGTVSARAIFDNPDDLLIPGQFVRVQVLLQTLDDIILIPESAVVQGPEGASVFVVDENNSVHFQPITLGSVTAEGQIVLAGLNAKDTVVINGQVGLRPDMPVNIQLSEPGESR